jgi:glyoxylase-like metal-dependent hydrolase (beta-lactamase superfamily II)
VFRKASEKKEPYHVDQFLEDGDELVTGKHALRVVHTPGHTLGHLSFYLPEDKLLICGDAVHNRVSDYLLSCPWFSDYSRSLFHTEPEPFVPLFLKEMLRSGAAKWQDERLVATTPYTISPD